MPSWVYIVIFIVIVLPISIGVYYVKRFIRRKINDGVDNAINKASAHYRNKKYQEQGQQSLADKYNQGRKQ